MSKLTLEDLKVLKSGAEGAKTLDVSAQNIAISKDNTNEPIVRTPQIDKFGRSYATGKRKSSIARVWLRSGSGKIVVNDKPYNEYFSREVLQMVIDQPFNVTLRDGQYDVMCTVKGGGLSGQAGAVLHGISCALARFDPTIRPQLKQNKFLTRDDRCVERKKYGQPKARKKFQFSKR